MQLLIVHHDPEMGNALVQMVKGYTRHHCQLVPSDAAAIDWARRHQRCDLLLTQLEAEGINGLVLGSAMSEIFSGLQVLFFPNYSADKRWLEIADTKVFPEPIVGDDLLAAIERAEKTLTGAPDLLHVVDVLQMCCLNRCSGAVQMAKDENIGLVFLRNGRIVHATKTTACGSEALSEIVAWKYVEFAYERSVRPPPETVTAPWHEILIEAVTGEKQAQKSHRQSV
jgi:Domain of unknown function (DUF4388)